MTVAGQPTVNYTYDANSRLTDISSMGLDFGFEYDELGRRTATTLPNGITTSYKYDNVSNLLELSHLSADQLIEKLVYSYDPNGNRTSMDRTSSFSGSTGESIVKFPAPASNITYNAANQMLTFNDESLSYDLNGNLIQKGSTFYMWNARNQLVGINGQNLTASFKYDALGRRIEKTINGKTTQYLYDGLDSVQEIESGMVSANYIRTVNIDEPLARIKADGTIRFYQQDALGSVVALTDESGIIKTQYVYDPFGNTEMIGEPSDNPFQFVGKENDGTGLMRVGVRYYSLELQRFISEDPIGLSGGDINYYAYTFNNPINFTDPLGLYSWDEFMEDWSTFADIRSAQSYWQNYGGPVGSVMSGLLSYSGLATVQESGETLGDICSSTGERVAAGARIVGVGLSWYLGGTTQVTGRIVGQTRTSRIIGLRNRFGRHFFTDEQGYFLALDRTFHRLHIGPWRTWFRR